MKIALLTRYGNLAASTRQRFLQYRPYLEAEGFHIEARPLLDDVYLKQLYSMGRLNLLHVVGRYIERIGWLLARCDADLLWLHCEAFPYFPGVLELLVRYPRRPIVFDYDDAFFHKYNLHSNAIVRVLLGRKLEATIKGSDMVFAGNPYLAEYALGHGRVVEIVPTVVDTEVYQSHRDADDDAPVVIGWIGTPSTWGGCVAPFLPVLLDVAATQNAVVEAVGARPYSGEEGGVRFLPWAEEREIELIQSMDIGIMPLQDTPWMRGKCGYKLIQYMACGLPVIASPVGVNREIVEHGVNGFLAASEDEWRQALATLIGDPDLRCRMGREGRKRAERSYSLHVHGPRVARLMKEVALRGRP